MYDAALTVGLPPLFTEHYVSRVTLHRRDLIVEAKSVKSKAFESLKSRWKLNSVEGEDGSCDVDFEVEMTVRDPVITQVIDSVLEQVAGRQVDAFQRRCEEIDGQKQKR
eukprot:CAMPEP_0172517028 /NCGR_PEP_ID=MMETSP1066-20121228/281209_1 /TAXON_ID=671091 /ORGANISM="Coscinodiscus wailesii, Strain CCMP2513" /LENGTH=108 /DNA_ID=CAMNT_0013298783 /DNA_START=275 /DNA_END=601 /DNA_ORIENTATION=+